MTIKTKQLTCSPQPHQTGTTLIRVLKSWILSRRTPTDIELPTPATLGVRPSLVTDENGAPRCVACMACVTSCPTSCIEIAAYTDLHGSPKLQAFELDELRCVACGLCVEACPVDALIVAAARPHAAVRNRQQAARVSSELLASDAET